MRSRKTEKNYICTVSTDNIATSKHFLRRERVIADDWVWVALYYAQKEGKSKLTAVKLLRKVLGPATDTSV